MYHCLIIWSASLSQTIVEMVNDVLTYGERVLGAKKDWKPLSQDVHVVRRLPKKESGCGTKVVFYWSSGIRRPTSFN